MASAGMGVCAPIDQCSSRLRHTDLSVSCPGLPVPRDEAHASNPLNEKVPWNSQLICKHPANYAAKFDCFEICSLFDWTVLFWRIRQWMANSDFWQPVPDNWCLAYQHSASASSFLCVFWQSWSCHRRSWTPWMPASTWKSIVLNGGWRDGRRQGTNTCAFHAGCFFGKISR